MSEVELAKLVMRTDAQGFRESTTAIEATARAAEKAEQAVDSLAAAEKRHHDQARLNAASELAASQRAATAARDSAAGYFNAKRLRDRGVTADDFEARKNAFLGTSKADTSAIDAAAMKARTLANQNLVAEAATARLGIAMSAAGLAAGVLGFALAKVIDNGREYGNIANRIRLVTNSLGEAARVQESLYAISQKTGQEFGGVVGTYTRIADASRALGASGTQIELVTENVSKALAVSQIDATAAANAALQLSQALSKGRLQGEDLKSILGGAPALARAIADGLGVGVEQLRQMGENGELLAKDVFNALLSQTDALDDKLGKLGPNVDRSATTLRNSYGRALKGIDDDIGATKYLSKLFDLISGTIDLSDTAVLTSFFDAAFGSGAPTGKARSFNFTDQVNEARRVTRLPTDKAFSASAGFTAPGNSLETRDAFRFRDLFTTFTPNANADLAGFVEEQSKERKKRDDEAKRISNEARARAREAERATIADQAERIEGEQEYLKVLERISETIRDMPARPVGDMAGIVVDLPKVSDLVGLQASVNGLTRARDAADEATASARQLAQALKNSLQNSLADGIEGLATRGLSSVEAFFSSLKGIALRTLSEIASSRLMGIVLGAYGRIGGAGGLAGVASSGGGIGSILGLLGARSVSAGRGVGGVGGEFGTVAGALGLTGKAGFGAKLIGGATSLTGLAAIGGAGALGSLIGSKVDGAKGVLASAASGALLGTFIPGVGNAIGAVIGGAAGLLGGLFGGAKKRAAAKELATQTASFLDQLTVRSLAASGSDFDARKKSLELEQRAELDAAVKQFGRSSAAVARLIAVQRQELDALVNEGSGTPSGIYGASSGFAIEPYRFAAGRPLAQPDQGRTSRTTITTGDVYITPPAGTSREMAEGIVRELQYIGSQQGVSRWSEIILN